MEEDCVYVCGRDGIGRDKQTRVQPDNLPVYPVSLLNSPLEGIMCHAAYIAR